MIQDKWLGCRISAEDRQQIRRLAHSLNMTLGEYVRLAALQELPADRHELRRVLDSVLERLDRLEQFAFSA